MRYYCVSCKPRARQVQSKPLSPGNILTKQRPRRGLLGSPFSGSSFLCLLLCVTLLFLTACSGTSSLNAPQSTAWYDLFDTYSTITIYGESQKVAQAAEEGVYEVLLAFHRETDIYHTYDGLHNLKTLNDSAGETPVGLSEELMEFLRFAVDGAKLTSGKVNPMLGAVTKLWKETLQTGILPEEEALQEAGSHTALTLLVLDETASTAFITDKEASIDVGAIAKGYACRLAAAYLAEAGIENYLLDLGGNIYVHGSPVGTGRTEFQIGLQDPFGEDGAYSDVISLTNKAAVTSGDNQRYVEIDGTRYHHIIDPDTLWPSVYHHSVTVSGEDPALCDLLSTALFNMTTEDGTALAETLDVEVIYQDTSGH